MFSTTVMLIFSCLLIAGGPAWAADATDPGKKDDRTSIQTPDLSSGEMVLKTGQEVEKYRYFTLPSPPRLVVDLYGTNPGFTSRNFTLAGGFSNLRVGVYEDKTRFVLDASGARLPKHSVDQKGNTVIVDWDGQSSEALAQERPVKEERTPTKAKAQSSDGKTEVESVDFQIEDGKSVFTILLSGPAQVIQPTVEGDVIHFGVKNAKLSRALRRIIDTSAFPSAVNRLVPYLVQRDGNPQVRFAAELKGKVPYRLKQQGRKVQFIVENQSFGEAIPPSKKVEIAVDDVEVTRESTSPVASAPDSQQQSAVAAPTMNSVPSIVSPSEGSYTGEEISLVFDDANIRNILQLIGEVGNLNIIAGEEVKGTITLRLIDVPWDQALDLIMETKGLGMIREGNVIRVLPKERIRAMRQAELTAVQEERQLEPLTTEIVSVSYSDLQNVAAPAKELLTDRGKITEDARNKQLIVTDVPVVVEQIKKLVNILDTPERQVMIEARIVEANSNFSRELGVKWGLSYQPDDAGSGDLSNVNVGLGGSFLIAPPTAGSVGSAGLGSGLTFGRVGIDSTILDLRISALENSGNGKVVSTPRVTTLNGGKALISQGTKIPYMTTSDAGTETKFENAELKLEVSPVINPDNSVILDIRASNSSVGATVPTGLGTAIAIDEKKAETKVLVRDGDTTVIGGIFVEDERLSEAGVPLLMHIPILGHLFKSTTKTNERRELLVFITPHIIN